jgi:hypothetical protein
MTLSPGSTGLTKHASIPTDPDPTSEWWSFFVWNAYQQLLQLFHHFGEGGVEMAHGRRAMAASTRE